MSNWAGSGYSHSPGDRFIFKGGVTWPSACFWFNILAGGNSSGNDYYGVDKTWFSGGSFTRPIFDGEHTSSILINIDFPHNAAHYITFDSFEMKRVTCQSATFTGLITLYDTDNILIENCWLHDWLLDSSILHDDAHGGIIGNFDGSAPAGIVNIVFDTCEIENSENGASGKWNGVCVRMGGVIRNCLIHDNSSAILFAQDVDHCVIYNISYPYSGFDPSYHFNGFYMDNGNGAAGANGGVNLYCRNTVFRDVGGGANMAYPNVEGYDCYIYNCLFYGQMSSQQAIEVDPYNLNFNLIPAGANYDVLGNYTVSGLVIGTVYYWSKGANDSGCHGLTSTGFFTATGTTQLITGTASQAVTAGLAPSVMKSCYIYNNTISLTSLPSAQTGIIIGNRPGLQINNLWQKNNLLIGTSATTSALANGTSAAVLNGIALTNLAEVTASAAGLDSSFIPQIGSVAIGIGTNLTSDFPALSTDLNNAPRPASGPWTVGPFIPASAPVVSPSLSTVSASPSSVVADGATTSTVTVTLLDGNSSPVSGKTVALVKTSGAGSPIISAPSGPSSVGGVVTFTIKSSTAATDTFTAADTTDSVTITQTASVTFTAPPSPTPGLSIYAPDNIEKALSIHGHKSIPVVQALGNGRPLKFTVPAPSATPNLPVYAPDRVERDLLANSGDTIPVAQALSNGRPLKFTVPV